MIEIAKLTEADVGRRVVWEPVPGAENPGQIAAWTDDKLLLAVKVSGKYLLRIVEDIDPREVRWAERNDLRVSKAS